ncbi:MAG: HEAT repeat domain-containing protein [Planctomycetes bacterium]|nr:HEAT repeat domain-containing protein [Planctomycetota bacterium]
MLVKLVKSGARAGRYDTFKALVHFGKRTSISALESGLTDPVDHIRMMSLEGLARAGAFESAARVVDMLDDKDIEVRRAALEALGSLRHGEAFPRIQRFLTDMCLRVDAIRALGNIGRREAIPHLMPLLDDLDPSTRQEVAIALARLRASALLEWTDLTGKVLTSWELRWLLNGYAEPRAFEKLSCAHVEPGMYKGCLAEILRAWGKQTGIIFIVEDLSDGFTFQRRIRVTPGLATLERALRHLPAHDRLSFIVEAEGVVRVMSREAAVDHWRVWFASDIPRELK